MIFDHISNVERYNVPFFKDIVSFIEKYNAGDLLLKEAEIKGRDLFVRPSAYETRKPSEGKFEAHQVYADLQYLVEGEEVMQGAPADGLVPLTEYDPDKDCQFFKVEKGISDHIVRAGEFAIFWPGEAHRPCCCVNGTPSRVKKFVFKIRMK